MSTGDLIGSQDALDAEAVRALVAMLGGDAEGVAEIVDAFLEEAPLRLSELHDGSAAGDAVLIGRAAHTLKANAAMFGAKRLEALCRALEEGARAGDLGGAAEEVDAIDAEWQVVQPLLVVLRDKGTAP